MKKQLRAGYLVLSFFILTAFICLKIYAGYFARESEGGFQWAYVSAVKDINVTVSKHYGGSLVFFNMSYPNINVMYRFAEEGHVIIQHMDKFGIYYLRTIKTDEITGRVKLNHWTLVLSLWWPLSISIVNLSMFFLANILIKKSSLGELGTPSIRGSMPVKNGWRKVGRWNGFSATNK